jgi:hypothetical protein
MTRVRHARAGGKEAPVIANIGWPHPITAVRHRIAWAAAWYRSARTTFEVVRLLDRETHFRSAPRPSRRLPFVARTGYIA